MDKNELPYYSGPYILTHTSQNSSIFFLLDFVKLYLLPQLHRQNTFQHLIKNLPLIYKQCREENTIKKYQQYLKTWKECTTENQVCFLPGELVYVGTLIDAWFLRQKVFRKVTVNCRPLQSFFLLLTSLKLQNESRPAKLKRKRYYVWTNWINVW